MPTNRPPSLPLFPTCQRWPIRLFLSSAPFCSFLRLTLFSSLLFSFPRSIASFLFRYNSSSPSSLSLILTYPPFLHRALPIFFAFFLSFSRFFLPLSAAFFLSLLSRSSLVFSRLVSSRLISTYVSLRNEEASLLSSVSPRLPFSLALSHGSRNDYLLLHWCLTSPAPCLAPTCPCYRPAASSI